MSAFFLGLTLSGLLNSTQAEPLEDTVTRVFIFAGQSNMEGADSKVKDIARFPPFVGLEEPQSQVRFSYCLGRENKTRSEGWGPLQPIRDMVGPELSFARDVGRIIKAPIAIIKCAAGGTHLGGDWNPDQPSGFKMYPLALDLVKASLRELDARKIKYRLEGFMWHQGENDMFNEEYMASYGKNLANFIAAWRRDLDAPQLKFYIGELCTKTIWGMDLRPRMYAIRSGQKAVTETDPLAEYVPTSHVGVEIGGGVGLHYHYGTLGQLQHGSNYATAYLRTIGKGAPTKRSLGDWPCLKTKPIRLFVLAGHRNMEGERAFVQDLQKMSRLRSLLKNDDAVPFRFALGGGYRKSDGWEPMGPVGYYDTFGPELSFTKALRNAKYDNIAIAKFTHSGSQINDWTPEGTKAEERHLYPGFIKFIQESIADLEKRGHDVELCGIFYHLGENDMSMPPYRRQVPAWLQSTIEQSRLDLERPELKWFVTQQPPTDHESVNGIDVTAEIVKMADRDPHIIHLKAFKLPPQEKALVLDTPGVLALGELMAKAFVDQEK